MAIPTVTTKPKTGKDGAAVEAPPADRTNGGIRDEEEGVIAEDLDSTDDELPQKIVTGTLYERICQPIILVVSAGLNIPPFILSMLSVNLEGSNCQYYSLFLIINGICCLINVGAVIFSIVKLRRKMLEDYVSHEAHIELQLERKAEHESRHRLQQLHDDKQDSQHVSPRGEGGEGVEVVANHEDGEASNTSNNGDKSSSTKHNSRALQTTTETADVTATSQSTTTAAAGAVEQVMEMFGEGEEGDQEGDVALSSGAERLRLKPLSHPRPDYHRRLSGFQGRVRSRRTQSSNRLRHLICYNAQISTYAIVFVFWVFWLSSGAQLESREYDESTDQTKLENCQDYHRDYVTTSVTLGFAYVAVLVTSILLSFCDRK